MYQDEEANQARRRQTERAINLARQSRWEDAVSANRAIIELFPNDADSYNRLGKAFMELNRYSDAKKAYRKALELDGTNRIATKNLERLAVLVKAGAAQSETAPVDPGLFIEEMGKSTTTVLLQTKSDVLAKLNAGDRLELRPQDEALKIEAPSGELVGTVEPKLRSRLIKLIEGGNKYTAAVTSVGGDECRIIIKETYQDQSMAGRPSFPTNEHTGRTRPYTKDSLIQHGTNVEELEGTVPVNEDEASAIDGGNGRSADEDTVAQEGHVRLNDAAEAEETDDDDEFDE